jgi:4-hydroxy-4-methyl-2-oxoglutarate aldolase
VSVLTSELVDRYRGLNGAAVANAIEAFGVRLRNEGFADSTMRCLFPEQPGAIGHAVTARIRGSAPPPVGSSYHDRTDWWTYIVSVPAPRMVVVEDIDEHSGIGAFVGEVHATILQALGCVCYATNGTVRDAEIVRKFGFQMLCGGVAVSHAFAHIVDFGEPVKVGGLAVATGDILFADAAGLQSVPSSIVDQIPETVDRMQTREEQVIAFCRSSRFSIDGLRALVRDLG